MKCNSFYPLALQSKQPTTYSAKSNCSLSSITFAVEAVEGGDFLLCDFLGLPSIVGGSDDFDLAPEIYRIQEFIKIQTK